MSTGSTPDRSVVCAVAAAALLAACSREAPGPAKRQRDADRAAAISDTGPIQQRWAVVHRQDPENRSAAPEAFQVRGTELRVLVQLDEPSLDLLPGSLIANLLEEGASLPIHSIILQRAPRQPEVAETTLVHVRPGLHYLYVPKAYNLTAWSIVVEEKR